LTSGVDGGEWTASRPSCCTHGETAIGTHWIGGSVGPRASLDASEQRKSCHCWELNPSHSVHIWSLYWLRYSSFCVCVRARARVCTCAHVRKHTCTFLNWPSKTTETPKILLGNQLCQCWTINQCLRDLYLHHQGRCGEWPYVADIYTSLTNRYLLLLVYYAVGKWSQTVWSPIWL
jgi:hypothetical protein